jgi:nicotinate-nucleotide--dimethylbenzimidazole phosphoribosyltransferase
MEEARWLFPVPDAGICARALARQAELTKPAGSLGRLEGLAVAVAAAQGEEFPRTRPAAAVLFAADHPVTRHGVSAYPAEVTAAMVGNFAGGGAASAVLCRSLEIPLSVVDVGVLTPYKAPLPRPGFSFRRSPVAEDPAGDIRVEDAMSERTFEAVLAEGAHAVDQQGGLRVLILGEMGIGNTTVAACVCAAILGGDPGGMVGTGTGVSGAKLERKRQVVRDAVARLGAISSPLEVIRRVGGRDLAALMGAMARAVERRILVLVDGFIATAAALALLRHDDRARPFLVFAHRSEEQAHGRVLSELGAVPLLDLGMRLGEASGALVAFPLLEAACRLHNEMATFASASVPEQVEGT